MATEEEMKKELQLSFTNFKKPSELEGVPAAARLLYNLLYLRPGNYPSSPEMGINIEQYIHSFDDEKTRKQIYYAIKEQIEQYVTETSVADIIVEGIEEQGYNILGIGFTLVSSEGVQQIYNYFADIKGELMSDIVIRGIS